MYGTTGTTERETDFLNNFHKSSKIWASGQQQRSFLSSYWTLFCTCKMIQQA